MGSKSLFVIKPEGFQNRFKILQRLIDEKFDILIHKELRLNKDMAYTFYSSKDKDEPWFDDYLNHMCSGKIVVIVVEKEGDVVVKLLDLIGAKDPALAEVGSIRKEYGIPGIQKNGIYFNAVSTSTNEEMAKKDIAFFFPGRFK